MSQNPGSSTNGDATILGSSAERIVEVVGDFEILGKLGQGGMGAVYRARQISLDREIALKILPGSLEADPEFVNRFQREARVAASLNHANLVKVYASGQADGCHYIAMELIEGETLGAWLKRGPLPPPEALRICADVARALEHGWQRAQLIHRDIKPGNIFLSVQGDVKVGDLGLAKTTGGDTTGLTQTGTAMGTPHYISPEQAKGDRDIDFRADIYSLGCTLYQMLTGRTPYEGRDPLAVFHQHIHAAPPAILKVLPQCPIPLARLVGRMLKKLKRERHASYGELIAHIESVLAMLAPASSALESTLPPDPEATLIATPGAFATPRSATPLTAPIAPPPKPPAKAKTALYGGIAAGVVVLGVIAFLVWPKEEKLTKAQLYAREHAAELAAAAATPIPATSAPTRSVPPPPGGPVATKWWPFTSDADWKSPNAKGREFKDGWLHLQNMGFGRGQPQPDGAVRTRFQFREGTEIPRVVVRNVSGVGQYDLGPTKAADAIVLFYRSREANVELGRYLLLQPLRPGDTLRLELRVLGDRLTGLVNDAPVIDVHDTRVAEAGLWGISATDGWFESAEVQLLSASGPPTLKLFDTPDKFGAPREGVEWKDGVLHLENHGMHYSSFASSDAILRASVCTNPDSSGPLISLRYQNIPGTTDHRAYQLQLRMKENGLFLVAATSNNTGITLQKWPLPRAYGPEEWARLELRVVGDTLTASLDGTVLGILHDSTITGPGEIDFWASKAGYFRDIEYVPLDGVAPLAAPAVSTGSWRDWITEKRQAGRFINHPNLLDDGTQVRSNNNGEYNWDDVRFRDGRIRITWTTPPAKDLPAVYFRRVMDASGNKRNYQIAITSKSLLLQWRETPAGGSSQWHLISQWALPPSFDPAKEYTVETRLLGDRLTVLLNDVELGNVQDATLSGAGGIGFYAPNGTVVRKFESQDMDPPTPSTRAVTSASSEVLTFGGHRYQYVRGVASWEEAKAKAEAAGGHLATITSAEEDKWLRETFGAQARREGTNFIHLGGVLEGTQWKWLTGEPFTYTGWLPGQPNGSGSTLQYFWNNDALGWDDRATTNSAVNPFLIEWDSAAPAAAAEPWLEVLQEPTKVSLSGEAERTAEGVRFTGPGSVKIRRELSPMRDGAVRLRAAFGGAPPQLTVRGSGSAGLYQLYARNPQIITMSRWDNVARKSTTLREFPLTVPLAPGQDYVLELRVVGQNLSATVNGALLGTFVDDTYASGDFGLGVASRDAAPTLVKSLEVLNLDAPTTGSAAGAAPSASINTASWISLLSKVDPAADAVKGQWSRVGTELQGVAEPSGAGVLQLPYEPPEEYDFRITYTTTKGKPEAWQLLRMAGRGFRWTTSAGNGGEFGPGFDLYRGQGMSTRRAGQPPLASAFAVGQRCESIVEVRRDRVKGWLNGRKIEELATDGSDLSMSPGFGPRDARRLGLGIWTSTTVFHDISVREVTGQGKGLR